MNDAKIKQWLSKHCIAFEESFPSALSTLAKGYKKKNICTLDEVYEKIGIRKQHISYWQTTLSSSQTRLSVKQRTIHAAAALFNLSETQLETLANKAGLSFQKNSEFIPLLQHLIRSCPGSEKDLYDAAQISERMFRYLKRGTHLKKEVKLSLAVTAGLSMDETQYLLQSAGFALSMSIPGDAVILWFFTHSKQLPPGVSPVSYLNDILFDLDLPLLMTRPKSQR